MAFFLNKLATLKVKKLLSRLLDSKKLDINESHNSLSADVLNKDYFNAGNISLNNGKFEEAIHAYQQAIIQEPNRSDVYFNLGHSYSNLAQPEKAIDYYNQSIKLNPTWHEPYLYLALIQKNQKKYEEAIFNCEKSIALKPGAEAFCELGEIFSRLGRLDEAAKAYSQALLLYPEHTKALFYLKDIQVYLGKKEEATDAFEKALSQNLDNIQNFENLGGAFWVKSNPNEFVSTVGKDAKFRAFFAERHHLSELGITFISSGIVRGIGPICLIDTYIKSIHLGWEPSKKLVLLAPVNQVANSCLLSYWGRYITIISDPLAIKLLSPLARCLEDMVHWGVHINGNPTYIEYAMGQVQKQWEFEERAPLLSINESHSEKGWQCLKKQGVPEGSWFVCLHIREGSYWQEKADSPDAYRNADPSSYHLAIKTITKCGGWVIRVGDPGMTPLPTMENFFDYALSNVKSDWMDIFLCASCRFFLGTNSGLYLVPYTFGIPCVLTNWLPMTGRPRSKHDLFILKLLYSIKDDCLLTFAEGMSSDLAQCYTLQNFEDLGVRIVNNSPEEINDLVLEMINRLEGLHTHTELDYQLKNQFDNLSATKSQYGVNGHIGQAFINKYSNLL